jgi:hypothetical protein
LLELSKTLISSFLQLKTMVAPYSLQGKFQSTAFTVFHTCHPLSVTSFGLLGPLLFSYSTSSGPKQRPWEEAVMGFQGNGEEDLPGRWKEINLPDGGEAQSAVGLQGQA